MSVKIRLFRRGRKKLALFDLVVADARAPRDGKYIDKIGVYNPNTNPATIEINEIKAFDWVMKGAQPTDTVKAMLSYKGILYHKHLQLGVNKGAITQEDADKKLADWKEAKNNKIEGKKDKLASAKATNAKSKFEAESKVNAAREETIKNKNKVVEIVPVVVAEESAIYEGTIEAPIAETSIQPTVLESTQVVETPPVVEAAPVVESIIEPETVVEPTPTLETQVPVAASVVEDVTTNTEEVVEIKESESK